jgi:signal transduction histidine kinase
MDTYITYIDKQISHNIEEYKEVDLMQLCKIANCTRIEFEKGHKIYSISKDGLLMNDQKTEYRTPKHVYNNTYILDEFLSLYNKETGAFFLIDTKDLILSYLNAIIFFVPFSILLFIYPLIMSIRKEKEDSMILMAGTEALLSNKSMIAIAENIHHELNTPLEVIDNKIEKIHGELRTFLEGEFEATKNINTIPEDRKQRNRKLEELNDDFDFIKTSSEQIYAVLENMKSFKHLRYSNGNKSLADIIEGGFKIMKISNSNFEFNIDHNLGMYTLKPKTLKNAELLSIMINHFKNSLEANASKIFVYFTSFEDDFLTLRILDNGNGIPKNSQANIFKANFSTKNNDEDIRGNGMFLNKHMLNTHGGNVRLVESSSKGTTLELRIEVIEKG